MPHNVPEEKEWLHLRDAICLGDVDAIVDQLLMEGIAVEYGEMEAELISMKTNLGWDSCAVVDKDTFKESINKLISESVAIPQPQDAVEFRTYKESLAGGRWDRIFDDMVGRTSGRTAPSKIVRVTKKGYDWFQLEGLSYYNRRSQRIPSTPETRQTWDDVMAFGKVVTELDPDEMVRGETVNTDDYPDLKPFSENIDRLIAKGYLRETPGPSHYTDKTPEGALEAMERRLSSGFSQEMAEALAQMELRVGELAAAVRLMGTSVPAPIVDLVESVETAVEAVEAESGGTLSRRRARAIREYIVGLGERASEENTRSVVTALQGSFPGITERDVTNAIRTIPGGSPLGRAPTVRQPRQPEPGIPMPQRGKSLIVANYLVGLGADAANTDMETFLAGINAANPGLSPPVELHDYHATVRRFPGLPRLSLVGRGAGGGSRPGERSGLSLEDRLQRGYQRPERRYGF